MIKIINNLLVNTSSCNQLANYADEQLVISIHNLIKIAIIIKQDGSFMLCDKKDIKNQIIIDNFYGILANNNYFDKLKYITINGDKKVILDIMKILSNIGVYDLYVPNNVISQVFFSNAIDLLKKTLSIIKQSYESITYSMAEYLQYEKNIIVTSYEVNKFCDDVDDLSQKLIKLSKKISALEKIN
jgi:ubiquinone biosynthesis protein UbiJ